MRGLIIGLVFCVGIFIGLTYFFPWPLQGWADYTYVFFTGIIGIATYKIIVRMIQQALNNN